MRIEILKTVSGPVFSYIAGESVDVADSDAAALIAAGFAQAATVSGRFHVVPLLHPVDVVGADTKSKILDIQGFDGASVVVQVGSLLGVFTAPDADSYLTPVLQHSDATADSGFEAVAAGDIGGGFTKIDSGSEDVVTQTAGYLGSKRYLRVLFDFTAGTGAIATAPISALGILGVAADSPAAPAPILAS